MELSHSLVSWSLHVAVRTYACAIVVHETQLQPYETCIACDIKFFVTIYTHAYMEKYNMGLEHKFVPLAMLYAGADLHGALEEVGLEDPFIHLATQDESFYARVVFQKNRKTNLKTICLHG